MGPLTSSQEMVRWIIHEGIRSHELMSKSLKSAELGSGVLLPRTGKQENNINRSLKAALTTL